MSAHYHGRAHSRCSSWCLISDYDHIKMVLGWLIEKGASHQEISVSGRVCLNPSTDPPLGILCPCSCSSQEGNRICLEQIEAIEFTRMEA